MTTVTGRYPATGSAYLVAEIDYSVAGQTITLTYRVRTVQWGWSDAQVATLSGAIADSYGYTASAPSSATQTLWEVTRTFTGSRGSSYTFGLAVSGAYNGWAPSVSATIAIPAIAPTAPGAPSVSLITGTSCRLTWTPPADNGGAAVTSYELQWATEPTFAAPSSVTGNLDLSHDVAGLAPGSTVYARVRATNSAGVSPWSATGSAVLLNYPAAPAAPTVSSIGATSASVGWSAPASDGGSAVTGYEVRYSTDAGMAGATVTSTPSSPRTLALAGLAAGTTYYVQVRALNAVGAGAWSTSATFATLAGFKVFDGAAFVPKAPQVFNGSAFVQRPLYRWNGTTWEVPS